jgi:hypothetical protein
MDNCAFYKIQRADILDLIVDYPVTKTRLIQQAIKTNLELSKHRRAVLEKNPIFDSEFKHQKALDRINDIYLSMREVQKNLKKLIAKQELFYTLP